MTLNEVEMSGNADQQLRGQRQRPWRSVFPWTLLLMMMGLGLPAPGQAQDIDIVSSDAGANADGRPELVAIGKDGHMYHRWRTSPAPDEWADWTHLDSGRFTTLVVRRGLDGRLFLFGLDRGELVIRKQAGPSASWLDQSFRTGTDLHDLAVANNQDGHFEVLALNGAGTLWSMTGLGDQDLSAASWSEWRSLGGHDLVKVVAERDGDGRVVAVALGRDNHLSETRQFSPTEPHIWTDWLPLGNEEVRTMALGRGADRTLWLVRSGMRQGLFARSLVATSPPPDNVRAVVPSPPNRIRTERPAPPRRPTAERPAKPDRHLNEVSRGPPPPDPWTAPVTLFDQPIFPITELALAPGSAGTLELFAIATDFTTDHNQVFTLVQGTDGVWPSPLMQVPKAPPALDRFTNLRFVLGRDGTNAVFVIDGTTGRAWVLARGRSAKWSDQRWRLLGRIGTPTAADLLFQAGLCLEFVPNVVDPDALRGNITDGVALNLKKALAGTPLDALIEAPEAVSRCINQRETLGLWIDHDINLPILRNTDILPRDQFALFALLVPEATIRRVFEEVWRTTPRELNWDGNPERHGAITLHGYDLTLKAPNQLVLSIEGSALSLDFHVRITGTFDAPGKKPWCSPRVEIDAPDAIISGISFLGVSLFMGLPVDYINQKFADAVEGKLGEKAPLLCKLSQALFSELYLPVPKDPAQAQILELSYDGVLVVSQGANTGILGYGSTAPQVRKREPHVELNVQPRIGTSAGIDRIQVDFKVTATDLKQPYTVEWLPSRPSTTTRLLSPETLRTSEQSLEARFEYEVAPSSVVRLYDLGAMTVTVTGSDGIARDVTESVSALTQPRKRQGP